MHEIKGDLFKVADAEIIGVTTNGIVNKYGKLVMGRGVALQFSDRYPWLPEVLGTHVRRHGNTPWLSYPNELYNHVHPLILSFPTKEHWRDNASINLIEASAFHIIRMLKHIELHDGVTFSKIVIPRPGVGLGRLKWEDVKEVLEKYLDDRFYIISP